MDLYMEGLCGGSSLVDTFGGYLGWDFLWFLACGYLEDSFLWILVPSSRLFFFSFPFSLPFFYLLVYRPFFLSFLLLASHLFPAQLYLALPTALPIALLTSHLSPSRGEPGGRACLCYLAACYTPPLPSPSLLRNFS